MANELLYGFIYFSGNALLTLAFFWLLNYLIWNSIKTIDESKEYRGIGLDAKLSFIMIYVAVVLSALLYKDIKYYGYGFSMILGWFITLIIVKFVAPLYYKERKENKSETLIVNLHREKVKEK